MRRQIFFQNILLVVLPVFCFVAKAQDKENGQGHGIVSRVN
jgi:hypothetical protein